MAITKIAKQKLIEMGVGPAGIKACEDHPGLGRHRSELPLERQIELDHKAQQARENRKPHTYYLVFERPVGSLTWIIAHKDDPERCGLACQFAKRVTAEEWIAETAPRRRFAWNGKPDSRIGEYCILPVKLPA